MGFPRVSPSAWGSTLAKAARTSPCASRAQSYLAQSLARCDVSPDDGAVAGQQRRRTQRRLAERARARLACELQRAARLEPGGAPERPLVIDSPVLVDLRAVAMPCLVCGGSLRLESHTAEVIDRVRLRVAAVVCTQCVARRASYFRLHEPSLH